MQKVEVKEKKVGRGSRWTRNRSRLSPVDKKELPVAYLMLLPAVVLLGIFVWAPFFYAVERSFYDWNFYKDSVFVGWDSYRRILINDSFQKSLRNGFKFVAIQVPLGIIVQFLFANMIKGVNDKAQNIVKGLIYIPAILSGIMASIITNFVLNYRGGIINQILINLGMERIAPFTSEWGATWVIIIMNLWLGFGGGVIMMYAALQSIPVSYYEAASIDGATRFQQMWYVTLPQMRNIFVLIAVNGITGTLQMFDIPFMLTGGGPNEATLTPMVYLYNNFRDISNGTGYAIAGALIMMVIITGFNIIVFRVIKAEKSQE